MKHKIYGFKIHKKCMKCSYCQPYSVNDCRVFGDTRESCDEFFRDKKIDEKLKDGLANT